MLVRDVQRAGLPARADCAHQRRHRRGEKLERAETGPLRDETAGQSGGIERADRVEMMGELHAVG